MQLTRATNVGLVWESNRSVIKDPNSLLIFSRQFYMINDGGQLELLADGVNSVLSNSVVLFCSISLYSSSGIKKLKNKKNHQNHQTLLKF